MTTPKEVIRRYPVAFIMPTVLMIVDILIVGIFTAKGEETFEYFVTFSFIVIIAWAVILAAGSVVLAGLESHTTRKHSL